MNVLACTASATFDQIRDYKGTLPNEFTLKQRLQVERQIGRILQFQWLFGSPQKHSIKCLFTVKVWLFPTKHKNYILPKMIQKWTVFTLPLFAYLTFSLRLSCQICSTKAQYNLVSYKIIIKLAKVSKKEVMMRICDHHQTCGFSYIWQDFNSLKNEI